MFESIQFKNFKVLQDASIPLARFTLLVGPNGSGKSTVLQALHAASSPESFVRQQLLPASAKSFDVDVLPEITLRWANDPAVTRFIWQLGSVGYGDEQSKAFRRKLSRIRIFALEADAIAAAVRLQPQAELQKNGANLAAVLDRLRDGSPERFQALNEELGRWLPEFDQILFDTPSDGHRAIMLRTRQGHHSIRAGDLSHGTLLALAILTLAYLPDPPSMIGLEEPDRGIHPRLLRDVRDALYRLCYPEQFGETRAPVAVIATTHSPYLLDLFKDHPEEVVIAQRTGQNVRFERLSDRSDLDEILKDSHLGDAWYSGVLGGVPTQ